MRIDNLRIKKGAYLELTEEGLYCVLADGTRGILPLMSHHHVVCGFDYDIIEDNSEHASKIADEIQNTIKDFLGVGVSIEQEQTK